MPSLKTYFLNLNFFGSANGDDEHAHRSNLIATRVYIILFDIILFILILALWLTPQTTKILLEYPTAEQFEQLPRDAYCPCSKISLSYGQFVSMKAKFHQVCSSDFITDRWIKSIFYGINATYYYRGDFRLIGSSQFRALASLCELTKTTIRRSISSFHMMLMISPTILSQSIVQSQAESSIEQFQLITVNNLIKQLQFVRKMIINNQLISALETNINPIYLEVFNKSLQFGDYVIYNLSNESYCDCQVDMDCHVPSGIFNDFNQSLADVFFNNHVSILFKIDGLAAGCLPMDSILQSNLQCFYNQTCLNRLLSYLFTNESFTAMNPENPSRFESTTMIKDVVSKLMVEEWLINISYEKYYNQCAPIVCTYSKVDRHDSVYVLTKVVSLLGGLTLVLTFMIPIIVRFLRRKKNPTPGLKISLLTRFYQFQIAIKRFLIQLNFFKHTSSTRRQIDYQCLATRFYLLFFLLALTILTCYILATKEVHQTTLFNPTEEQFNQLQQLYPTSLSCPCGTISVSYKNFIQMEPLFHQICSSDLISQRWIDYYNNNKIYIFTSPYEFEAYAGHQFQILASFCEQAQQTISDSLELFLQKQFVNSHVIFPELFHSQINQTIEEWKSNTLNSFLRPIQLIRITNQGNQLLNSFHNFEFNINKTSGKFQPVPANYSTCSCARSSTCHTNMGIFIYNWTIFDHVALFRIPNFFTGCFPVESLLESTLECFYDEQCINTLKFYMNNTTLNFPRLDSIQNSPNETIQSVVDRLMIDLWILNVSFNDYYETCSPLSCTYEYTRQNDIFYLISSILGLFAGLLLGIKIFIIIFLRLIEKFIEGFSWFTVKKQIKSIFICQNEQQITNRFHFILLIVTIVILYLASSLTLITRTEQVIKPSLSTYETLLDKHKSSLQCPCLHLSIEYQSFLTIQPHMHEICSSAFVSDAWLDLIYNTINPFQFHDTDFQRTALGQYQFLSSFCQLSQQVVNDGLKSLTTGYFIDSHLLSSDLLNTRMQTIMKEFQMTLPNSFLNSLSLIRQITGVNMLMNLFMTNAKFQDNVALAIFYLFHTIPLEYENCNCGISSKCVRSSGSMMSGCYPLEALLQSTLKCFYNQTCIDSTNTYQALNISSRFSMNATIESILNELMMEDYSLNISYQNYFSQCQPISCSYSYVGYRDIIEVSLTVIGLYGGLAVIARVIVVLCLKLRHFRKHRVNPETT